MVQYLLIRNIKFYYLIGLKFLHHKLRVVALCEKFLIRTLGHLKSSLLFEILQDGLHSMFRVFESSWPVSLMSWVTLQEISDFIFR